MIELSNQLLLYIIVILLLFCGIAMIYLIYQRRYEERKKHEMEKYIQKTKILWQEYILEDGQFTDTLIPKSKIQILAVEHIFLSYLRNISNPIIQQKIYTFAQMNLKEYYQNELKSRNWSKKMNAMYRIADFHIKELISTCEVSINYNRSIEVFQLLKIYSILEKEKFIQEILLCNYSFSESEYKKLFSYLEVEMLQRFMGKIEISQQAAQYALIDTISAKGSMDVIEGLEELLVSEDTEIRIRTLRGLERIGVIRDLETYIPFVNSTIWEERLMVAKLFKYAPFTYTAEHLEKLLQDSNWWVRSQAASTIIEDPRGYQRLKEFIATTNDQYAIDMANEVLEKRMRAV
ncbi:HEAT repeat domain-containing protein [Lysinibacillus sp. NPDC093688]|uniref:HEAT repeat domain-containing protein n=1 Tax=Lysinibacillus sp. NPDC093688 TaxID=3390577 RepID=UPI003D070B1E